MSLDSVAFPLPPSNRTEDPDPRGAASMHRLKDLAATGPQVGPHRDSHALHTAPRGRQLSQNRPAAAESIRLFFQTPP